MSEEEESDSGGCGCIVSFPFSSLCIGEFRSLYGLMLY